MNLINYFTVSLFVGSLTALCSGLFVYYKNSKALVGRVFLWVTISSAVWSAGYLGMIISTEKSTSWYCNWILHAAAILIPAFFVHFALALIKEADKHKRVLILAYCSSIFLLALNPTTLFIKDMKPKFIFNYVCDAGPLYILFALDFFLWIVYSSYKVINAIKISKGLQGLQYKYALFASLAGFIGGGSVFLLTYNIPFPPYPLPLFAIYPVLTAYAIIKYQLMDIRVAVARTGIFFFVYTVVLGIPFIIGYVLFGRGLWYIPLLIGILLASAGPFAYSYLQRRTEARLRKEEFLAHQELNKLAQRMARFTRLKTLLKVIVHRIVNIIKVDSASLYLKDETDRCYRLLATRNIDRIPPEQIEFDEDSALVKELLYRRIPTVAEELTYKQTQANVAHIKRLQSELNKIHAALVIPAFKGDSLFGFLALGKRQDERVFTQEDLNLLMLLSSQTILAIENARLVEKDKSLLAEKSRRDALADMAPGVAHQFNNRLMAISTTAEAYMLLMEQKPFEELTKEEIKSILATSKATVDIIAKEAIRGGEIADAILKKGRAKLNYARADLGPIIQSAVELLRLSRTKLVQDGVPEPEVVFNIDKDLPKLILSESLIQDSFYNMVDNARDATITKYERIQENKLIPEDMPYKGKIIISAFKKDDKVVVTIQDNGIGMDERHFKRLFVPYFTTKATSTKGTGMGLWVIRSFIEAHKGKISVDSQYAKGTTFRIELPIDAKIEGYSEDEEKSPNNR